ncbi:MAG TPA: NotI family restriction endonuclease [Pyrinomonadaceae bacterium]|nr:NotI family restriction endonuclease [Pyrinomonadaceae bacterium]
MTKPPTKLKTPPAPRNPLAEVFGFTTGDKSERALHYQVNKLCPFNNIVPSCTKVSVLDPLGVCSLHDKDSQRTVICPVRFKEDWLITTQAANFFFPPNTQWTAMPEIRLTDIHGKAAGNIDLVLVAYDDEGYVTDFGAVEIQAVYISGNLRRPFRAYVKDLSQTTIDWSGQKEYPRADYLSSSRKRLAPQLIYKGGILRAWRKRAAVVIDRKFFESLPNLSAVSSNKADIAWLVYDLQQVAADEPYHLVHHQTIFTEFGLALDTITRTEAGPVEDFIKTLQGKLKKLKAGEPVTDTTLDEALTE